MVVEAQAKKLKDEYISVEHIFLELIRAGSNTAVGRILREFQVSEEIFLNAFA